MTPYQSDETKAFPLVDKDLSGLPIFCKHLPEIVLCDVVGQVTNKQAAPLCVGLLTWLQQHGQRRLELSLRKTRPNFFFNSYTYIENRKIYKLFDAQ